ncbi:Hypothetical protein CINCED_3A013022 [Cinara cedri]|uniref:Uncharacterized protein n=1 Tax=Cinara cedri TaxID=506608 RepID=A0A5E4MSW1_9HEMI|nr:Hypothetical protein CINCED_3A013022 [Cinara cedri]
MHFSSKIEGLKNKLKARNNIISKLAGSTWGSDTTVLRVLALALVYSVAEYCALVWFSSYCKKVFTELNQTMRIITGSIRTTEVQWLPVLENIAPPDPRRLMHAERMVDKIKRNPKLPLYENITTHPHKSLKSRHPIWDLTFPVEALSITWKTQWKDSGVRGVTLIENPEIRTPGFDLPRKLWSTLNRIRTEQGRCKSLLHK